MADNGHKSNGYGWFNPDDRLKQIISSIASEKDLKSLRCTFLLLLEHPEVKPRLIAKYGDQAFKELVEKYNVTTKDEKENSKRKQDSQRKQRIQAFQVLGFSQEDAEKLSELSSEDLKTMAYLKQNMPHEEITPEERKLREEIALCELRLKDKKTANPEFWNNRLTIAKAKLEALQPEPQAQPRPSEEARK
jgi:DNA-binding transcriptional MerR regulator